MLAEWAAVIVAAIAGVVSVASWVDNRRRNKAATEQQRRQAAAKLSVWWANQTQDKDKMHLVVDNQTPATIRNLQIGYTTSSVKNGEAKQFTHQLEYVPKGTWQMRYVPWDERKKPNAPVRGPLDYIRAVPDLGDYAPNQAKGGKWDVVEFSWLDGVDEDEVWTRRGGALELG